MMRFRKGRETKVTYRKRIISGPAPRRGWQAVDIDALNPGERERLLDSKEHLVQEQRNGDWFDVSTWEGAMSAGEKGAREDVARLASKAEDIRAQAAKAFDAVAGRLASAKAVEEEATQRREVAEADMKPAGSAKRKSESEASDVDKQQRGAEKELVSVQRRQPVQVG